MLTGWRIAKARYAGSAFDGEGARLHGGRWNTAGVRVAYASGSVSLAALEVLAGLQRTSVLPSYSLLSVQFDESQVEVLPTASLPPNWRTFPAPPELQGIGNKWISEKRSLVLQVPSAIIDSEVNYLLNPAHGSFESLMISEPSTFELDRRIAAAVRGA